MIGPLIGAVSATSANIWLALDEPAEFRLTVTPEGGAAFDVDGSCSAAALLTSNLTLRGLTPNENHVVSVTDRLGKELCPPARFRTMPEETNNLSFAFVSCHRPAAFFGAADTFRVWKRLGEHLDADSGFASFLLHVGDQIYADPIYDSAVESLAPDPQKRLAARRDEFASFTARLTHEYAALYQTHWSPPDVAAILRRIPNYMIWDDHDIADGWGSRATSGWDLGHALFGAASTAYRFFQDSHNPVPSQFPRAFSPTPSVPQSYGFGFTVGKKIGFLIPDQRSFRQGYSPRANEESGNHAILGDRQATDISRWLASSAAQGLQVLVFVATVPFFHSSPATINVGTAIEQLDAADNWISGPNKPDLAFLLDHLFSWQKGEAGRRVVVLGGDVHMANAATITRPNESIVQFVSSPVTNTFRWGAEGRARRRIGKGLLVGRVEREV